ncbi:MAG: glycoside hydrolase family 3 N-terminal domain-containing protein [Atopobiaceae bacterium]|jgi:beta-N-acetylhexosaminidase|nr:glycoside hydrolase family 3 protein [Atopobiaceae bacterium]MCH4181195.1 glycoside hydrolase family 3 protein [Atopobiaceae bacterium]MCH4214960.1 glycoside hydrolase family 3 protein [Atopobiaceae bacterium]MCH4230681.1 glycoside hydrolase family 3 protein [Atopobiaceae bacterium]MCH4277111.1 glycoside hydrolase family 3 protein [Atopobiaceae bacterium]
MRLFSRREALALVGTGASAVLVGCASDASAPSGADDVTYAATTSASVPQPTPAEALLARMTLEQKVAQLFLVTPEQLTGVETATVCGDLTRSALAATPVGGLCYFGQNITGDQQLRDMLSDTLAASKASGAGVPAFLTVDEEGGPLVARVAKSGCFDVATFPSMARIGATGDTSKAAEVGTTIGGYLHDIGFNVDFAPDADVLTNPDNKVIGSRSFGSDPDLVASMVSAEVTAFLPTQVLPCVKHFPGHGNTAGDSHTGAVTTDRTMADLESCELRPFSAAVAAGCPLVMVGHISTPNATSDGLPASLSHEMVSGVLRGTLGFTGVVVSDSFSMGAITKTYDAATAAVDFLSAGGDMVLMPEDLSSAYQGVLSAVSAGTLDEDRIDESVGRILAAKESVGLLV